VFAGVGAATLKHVEVVCLKRFAGGSTSDSVVDISLISRQSAVTVKIRTYERLVDETTTATVYSWTRRLCVGVSDSASLRRVMSAVGVETCAVNHATPGYRLSAAAIGAMLRGISNC